MSDRTWTPAARDGYTRPMRAEAKATAKRYTMGAFADEKIADLGLEEVVPDDEHRVWRITVAFSGPPGVDNRSIADTVAEILDADRRATDTPAV